MLAKRWTNSELEILGDVELLAARHAIEDRPRLIDGDEIEIDAVDLDLAGVERLHPVIKSARERKLQLGHLLFFPVLLSDATALARALGARKPRWLFPGRGRMTRPAGNDAACGI